MKFWQIDVGLHKIFSKTVRSVVMCHIFRPKSNVMFSRRVFGKKKEKKKNEHAFQLKH